MPEYLTSLGGAWNCSGLAGGAKGLLVDIDAITKKNMWRLRKRIKSYLGVVIFRKHTDLLSESNRVYSNVIAKNY